MNARHLYRKLPCLAPGCHRRPTCFCHLKHGLRGKSKWEHELGFPGCDHHHNIFDGRNGSSDVSRETTRQFREMVGEIVPQLHALIDKGVEAGWSEERLAAELAEFLED